MIRLRLTAVIGALTLLSGFVSAQVSTDILIIGGGASGTTAGIQAARLGVSTLIVEETEWLGGMLTAAGVSAIDGDHKLPAGLWGEFREELYQYYGGPAAVETGWVSNTLFEPSVGNRILKKMVAREPHLQVWYNAAWTGASRKDSTWQVVVQKGGKLHTIEAKILIDATELGDVVAKLGVPYRIGMDSRHESGEVLAPEAANDIIQDLTYVVTLKDYGKGANKTIKKPSGYNPAEFDCSCDVSDPASYDSPSSNCYKMLQYGRLPNNKYMINWPKCGNDIYLNLIEKTPGEREEALKEAKLQVLRFVYYIQTVLGYKHLGIADDEYPTKDKLPMIPYHRESRRVKGLVTLSLPHVAEPYRQDMPLYRTGIAVGDYPIDHHHLKNPAAPPIDFVKIKVPSYNVPLGSLIPEGVGGLVVAEKSISVTNIVNGATRLQPVVLQLGQAAGIVAALAVKEAKQPAELDVRRVQETLLNAKGYIMPFIDVAPSDPQFAAIQRVGATGILKGVGVPYRWANQTWFYPELPLSQYELVEGLKPYYPQLLQYRDASGELLDTASLSTLLAVVGVKVPPSDIAAYLAQQKVAELESSGRTVLSRRAVALLVDVYLKPFQRRIDMRGHLEERSAAAFK
jgi:hypothetical protein